jgi:pimeloyl-ACP methyl ester carboxylesterase
MKIIFFLILSFFIFSCNKEEISIHDNENNIIENNTEGIKNTVSNANYEFKEGFIKTTDNVNLYYRLYSKVDNKGLIVLSHKEDSSLEEWNILMDIFLKSNYNIISYDLRGYGKSKDSVHDFNSMLNDLKLLVDYAELSNASSFKSIILIGNCIGGNLSLYSSQNYCSINSSFIIISPNMEFEEMPIDKYNQYCSNPKYLFLYSRKDLDNLNENLYV